MNRIFISYRSSDGKKDADRLCADLSRVLGDDQVFFDKQDLQGGTSWRHAIEAALGTRPVVLLLLTADLFGMSHPEGGRRIDREDDPIRNELLSAQQSGATIVPLLTEGMVMPPASSVPLPLRFISEAHALKLRTDDWANDLQRILADLRTHGIGAAAERRQDTFMVKPVQSLVNRLQRWLMYIGGGFVALMVLGYFASEDKTTASGDVSVAAIAPPAPPAPIAGVSPGTTMALVSSLDVSGVWWSIDPANRRTRVQLIVSGQDVRLTTDAVPVAWYPEWQAYALKLREQGVVLTEIRYFGDGILVGDQLQLPYRVYSSDGGGLLDTGNISLRPTAGGSELTGQLWSNGDQTAAPLRLVRRP